MDKQYYRCYVKTREMYRRLKGGSLGLPDYKFVYFKGEKQKDFIKENESEIIRILKECVPLNKYVEDNNEEVKQKYNSYMKKLLKMYAYSGDAYHWYFGMVENKIAVLCFLGRKKHIYKLENKLQTYRVYRSDESKDLCVEKYEEDCKIIDVENLSKLQNSVESVGPIIYSFCKDKVYPHAGRFLLKNLFKHLKKKFDKVYLIQESILFKDNYSDIFGFDTCRFVDLEKYRESNKRLANYYKGVGMGRMKGFYDIFYCFSEESDVIHYMFFKVFYKDL